jgi:protein O-GlcNAc transferase
VAPPSPNAAAQQLRAAVASHRAGDLDKAAKLYAAVLALDARQPDALHLSGVVAFQRGRHKEALRLIGRAMQAAPAVPDFANSRGLVRRETGDLDGAEADFAAATTLNPEYGAAWLNLGQTRLLRGRIRESIDAFRRAVELAPDAAEAHAYLGTALLRAGDHPAAVQALRQAVRLDGHLAEAHYNLGIALERQGDETGAEQAWRRAIEANPFYLKPWNHLGLLLQRRGSPVEARTLFERAVSHATPEAPGAAELWNNFANLLEGMNEVEASLAAYDKALALAPDDVRLRLNYGSALLAVGLNDEARVHLERARQLAPAMPAAAHSAFFITLYTQDPAHPPFDKLRAWSEALPRGAPDFSARDRDPQRRLKLGYVSPDFFSHSVAYFFEPILAAHDRAAVEVFCYANVRNPDTVTERLQRHADHWRDVRPMSDEELAAAIRDDGIDILIDLAGHTVGSRLAAFAYRPAPIQATWIGYPATTGLAEIDWRITDEWADPPGLTDAQFSERPLRLPGGFNAYRPPERAPEVGPLPALGNGAVTFGSFNFAGKLNPATLDRWAELLRRLPASRLIIKHRGLAVARLREALRARFVRQAIDPGRLDLIAFLPDTQGHLAVYNKVDIALDSFPYNGTTTTCEALWMGVPVVTQAGASHMSRVGASLLTRVGLNEWIAQDGDAYLEIAARMAGDLPALVTLRATLRDRLARSPACDAAQVTRELEVELRRLWREWCTSLPKV